MKLEGHGIALPDRHSRRHCDPCTKATHHGAVSGKYLQRYLDEFVFRFNRRRAKSPAHGFARVLQDAVRIPPATHRKIVAAGAT